MTLDGVMAHGSKRLRAVGWAKSFAVPSPRGQGAIADPVSVGIVSNLARPTGCWRLRVPDLCSSRLGIATSPPLARRSSASAACAVAGQTQLSSVSNKELLSARRRDRFGARRAARWRAAGQPRFGTSPWTQSPLTISMTRFSKPALAAAPRVKSRGNFRSRSPYSITPSIARRRRSPSACGRGSDLDALLN